MKMFLKFLIGVPLLAAGILLIVQTFASYRTKKEIGYRIQTLQHYCFESLSGEQTCIDDFNPDRPTLIMYFHPECEHCQYESGEIGRQKEVFEKVNMILITPDDSIIRVETFALRYRLWEIDNLTILIDRNNSFKRDFGTAIIPSLFLYGQDKRLFMTYKGEVQINSILKALKTL